MAVIALPTSQIKYCPFQPDLSPRGRVPRTETAAGGAQNVHQHAREEGGGEGRGET